MPLVDGVDVPLDGLVVPFVTVVDKEPLPELLLCVIAEALLVARVVVFVCVIGRVVF